MQNSHILLKSSYLPLCLYETLAYFGRCGFWGWILDVCGGDGDKWDFLYYLPLYEIQIHNIFKLPNFKSWTCVCTMWGAGRWAVCCQWVCKWDFLLYLVDLLLSGSRHTQYTREAINIFCIHLDLYCIVAPTEGRPRLYRFVSWIISPTFVVKVWMRHWGWRWKEPDVGN